MIEDETHKFVFYDLNENNNHNSSMIQPSRTAMKAYIYFKEIRTIRHLTSFIYFKYNSVLRNILYDFNQKLNRYTFISFRFV